MLYIRYLMRKEVGFGGKVISNEVLKNCRKGEPVYLTKNGIGGFAVMDIEDYERDHAQKKLLMKLQEAEEVVKDGEGWLNLDELKVMVEE